MNKNFLYLQNWFHDNCMYLNPRKRCHMSFSSNSDKNDLILEDTTNIIAAKEYIVLVVAIDHDLT